MVKRELFIHNKEEPILQVQQLMDKHPWLLAGFTTRLHGVSQVPYDSLNVGLHVGDKEDDVVANRKKVTISQGYSFDHWVCANQTHGSNLYHVTSADQGKGHTSLKTAIDDVDALYTKEANLFLVSFYADCVPLYVMDIKKKIVGIAHAGWKGTVAQIGVKLIKQWQEEFHSNVEDICVVIGPSIGSCCYEVDGRVVEAFQELQAYFSPSCIINKGHGKFMLNLKQINHDFFIKAGILAEHIEVSSWCTCCYSNLFFSHRREKGKTGRMLAFIAIKPSTTKEYSTASLSIPRLTCKGEAQRSSVNN